MIRSDWKLTCLVMQKWKIGNGKAKVYTLSGLVGSTQLNPTQGHEINKTRPCVIISPDEMQRLAPVLIAPMTSKGFAYPCRIPCKFEGKKGLILLDQMRVADKTRLIKCLGEMDKNTQLQICDKMQEMFTYE